MIIQSAILKTNYNIVFGPLSADSKKLLPDENPAAIQAIRCPVISGRGVHHCAATRLNTGFCTTGSTYPEYSPVCMSYT